MFLFLPEGDGPFPVVVTVHGGPESQWRPWYSSGFGALTQYLVARGYAVAAPNVRGSTGYGKRFEHLDDVEKRLDSVADLASLHEWLSARPEIDGSRAVVYGRSYGGYMVLAALAFQPELWAAGIEFVGISNLRTFLENTSVWRRAAREREYGPLSDPELLERLSPWSRLDAIKAPLFIEHGRNDPRVPVSESEAIHARARPARRSLRARDLRGRGAHGGEAREPRRRVRAGHRLPRRGARARAGGADTMTAARRLGRVVRHGSAKPSTPVRLR